MKYNERPCNTIKYHAIPCNTMKYHVILWNAIQYHPIQLNTTQCNTKKYHAIQLNTIQYSTMHSLIINRETLNLPLAILITLAGGIFGQQRGLLCWNAWLLTFDTSRPVYDPPGQGSESDPSKGLKWDEIECSDSSRLLIWLFWAI